MTNSIVLKARQQGFSTVTLPIIRSVFPTLMTQSIVTVQPMTQPSGVIFDYKYTNMIVDDLDNDKPDIYDDLERILNEDNNE